MAESAARAGHGAGDLYVAMTRCTQRLRVLHRRPLPAGLAGLAPERPEEPAPHNQS
jgi:hypothetical protein